MADQLNLKKRLELLRLFINEGHAVNAQLVQQKLLLSESSFFKTMRELNVIIHQQDELNYTLSQSDLLLERLLLNDYEKPDHYIAQIFQTNSPTKMQFPRYVMALKLLQQHERLSVAQLVDYSSVFDIPSLPADAFYWGKTEASRILKNLLEEGLVTEEVDQNDKTRYYSLATTMATFTAEQLKQILYFISHIVYKSTPSAAGYLIMNKIQLQLGEDFVSSVGYPYTYTGRLLDEPLCYELLEAIQCKKFIELHYFTVKEQRKSVTKTTQQEAIKLIPLQVIYDATYYRWYLIGKKENGTLPFDCYRIDYIQSIKVLKETAINFDALYTQCVAHFKNSWCVSDEELVKIEVMFYQENVRFIEERVRREGQHGEIVQHFDDGRFLWHIETRGTAEITPWLRSFGSSCEILEPASLREQFIREWKEVYSYYAQ